MSFMPRLCPSSSAARSSSRVMCMYALSDVAPASFQNATMRRASSGAGQLMDLTEVESGSLEIWRGGVDPWAGLVAAVDRAFDRELSVAVHSNT
mgnify:CR=1 FL=1